MKPFIQITRHLYEEPHHLNLVIIASNGRAIGCLEFCLNASDLKDIGESLLKFNYKQSSNYVYELGSEKREDKFAHYFLFRAFPTGKNFRSYAIQIRLNNNEKIRDGGWPSHNQESDFCIETDIDDLRMLGKLLTDFARLEEDRLYWKPGAGYLDTVVNQKFRDLEHAAFAVLPK